MSFDASTAIRISSLSKSYWVFVKPWHRIAKYALDFAAANLFTAPPDWLRKLVCKCGSEIDVLDNLNFSIDKGQIFGLVGRNGAGKSTLLHLICGTQLPTRGSIEKNGKIAALLELGSGFNPNFTGRENVYFNAQIFGLTRTQTDERFQKIVEFADIGDYIEREVSTYSSGMFVRLAFAVVAHVDADILVIDEALAVGDVFFQQKCLRYLREFRNRGGTIIFVTHDTATVVSLCDKAALLLPKGQPPVIGTPDEVVKRYLSERNQSLDIDVTKNLSDQILVKTESIQNQLLTGQQQIYSVYSVAGFRDKAESFGDGRGQILNAYLISETNPESTTVVSEEFVKLVMRVRANGKVIFPAFGFMIKDRHGQFLFAESSDPSFRDVDFKFEEGQIAEVVFKFKMPTLVLGEYSINLAFADGIGDQNIQLHWLHDALSFTCIESRLIHGIAGVSTLELYIELLPEV